MNALIKVKIEFNNNGNPVNVMNILKDYPCLSMYLHDFMKAKDGYISKAEIHNNNIQDCDICNTFLCYVDC